MAKTKIAILMSLVALPLSAQTFTTTSVLPRVLSQPLSNCTNVVQIQLDVPVSGVVDVTALSIAFSFAPAHTWYGDVRCVVINPSGLASMVMASSCDGSVDDSSDLLGPYVLDDTATELFDSAATTAGGTVPAGTYVPDVSLNQLVSGCIDAVNGTWAVVFSDVFPGDIGSIASCSLTFSVGPPLNSFAVCQTAPGALTRFVHRVGSSNIIYTNLATIGNPGSIPFGWWFGLNLPLFGPLGLSDQLSNPAYANLFAGSLSANVVQTLSFSLPAGLNFQMVGVHFDPASATPVFAALPVDFTVL